ncbi:PAC2 family protein [Candidatus Woesearchaeota archaeon]|nr:PAC2 family protein [Candidatus Woesearchaeota archaeon]
MSWKIIKESADKIKSKNAVLIEGLPGIGNVGKVAADFLVEELKAKEVYELFSYSLPNSVFVNDMNLVELPKIKIYHKQLLKRDFFFLVGDVQPVDEIPSYEFCEAILDICEKQNVSEIITLGGIGLSVLPKQPKVFCTGNSKKLIVQYKKITNVNTSLYGVVGPIIGASGLLLGLSEKRKIQAVSLLAETLGHPMYLGIKGAREVLNVLNTRFHFGIDLKKLNEEIREIESMLLKKTEDLASVSKNKALKKLKGMGTDLTYIG